jgi:hypothetical protein
MILEKLVGSKGPTLAMVWQFSWALGKLSDPPLSKKAVLRRKRKKKSSQIRSSQRKPSGIDCPTIYDSRETGWDWKDPTTLGGYTLGGYTLGGMV